MTNDPLIDSDEETPDEHVRLDTSEFAIIDITASTTGSPLDNSPTSQCFKSSAGEIR